MVGLFGYRILKAELLAHGFTPAQTDTWTWLPILVLGPWVLWSYFRHKGDAERQEAGFEQAFEKALEDRDAQQKGKTNGKAAP
jgi:hypothetical protein